MENVFQGTSYSTRDLMLHAIAGEYLSGSGLTPVEHVLEDYRGAMDEAQEAVEQWDLDGVTVEELAPVMDEVYEEVKAAAEADDEE